jgi:hypothetical protein
MPAPIAAAICCIFLVFALPAHSQSTYSDPQQHFTVQVPSGWTAKAFNTGGISGVDIAKGEDAYVQIFVQTGIDPASFLKALNNGIQTSHPGYRVSNRGIRTVGGVSRMYISGEAAETPTAPRTRVTLETFAANGLSYAIVASSSLKSASGQDVLDNFNATQQIVQTIAIKGIAAGVKPPPSAPASAPAKAPATGKAAPPAAPAPAPPPAAAAETHSESAPPELSAADQKKLTALDTARKNGVLSEEEYQVKKGALLASAHSQAEKAARQKALDEALADGVLTQSEYDRKKKELGGDASSSEAPAAPPATETASAAPVAPPPAAAAPVPTPPPAAAPPAPVPAPVPVPAPAPVPVAAPAPAPKPAPAPAPLPAPAPAPVPPKSNPPPPAASAPPRNSSVDSDLPPLGADVAVPRTESQPDILPRSWTTDRDPGGFTVNVPGNWSVIKLRATGQVVVRGTRAEEVMIWPLRLKQPDLDARGAAAILQELARKFDALMPWGAVQTNRTTARVIGLGPQRTGTAMLSWANHPSGASVYFYGVEAPASLYSAAADSFAAILRSFQVVQDPSLKTVPGAGGGSGPAGMNFAKWTDPHEGAFTVSVPQAWHVIGGTYRLSKEDVRYGVWMESPDGLVRASIGDSVVGSFTQSTQALAAMGLREGSYQTLPDGTRVEVLRYLSGQQFARSYVETLVARQCNNPQISANNSREDMAANFGQTAASQGFINALLTAGDVSFTCSLDGRPVKGKYIAATLRMAPNVSPMWFVYRLFGYIASAGHEQEAENVLIQMIQSWKLTPEWEALQKDAAAPSVQPDNARAQEIRDRAQESILEDQRVIAEMTNRGSQQRQRINADLEQKLQSSILGSMDIVDPETRTQYRLNNFSDFRYLSNDGEIFSANSQGGSGASLRDMIAAP